jgi:hypothetical protein
LVFGSSRAVADRSSRVRCLSGEKHTRTRRSCDGHGDNTYYCVIDVDSMGKFRTIDFSQNQLSGYSSPNSHPYARTCSRTIRVTETTVFSRFHDCPRALVIKNTDCFTQTDINACTSIKCDRTHKKKNRLTVSRVSHRGKHRRW